MLAQQAHSIDGRGGPTIAASFVGADHVDEAVLLRGKIRASGISRWKACRDALTAVLSYAAKLGVDTLENFTHV
jgi:hypothetical protein